MKFSIKNLIILSILLIGILFNYSFLYSQKEKKEVPLTSEKKILDAMFSISSHTLFDYIKELCSEKYGGRLTGTAGYDAAAQWVASLLKKWGIKPGGDNGSYFQNFPNPYTLVLEGGYVVLHIPYKKDTFIEKHYEYEKDFIPGSTSGSGEVKAEVVYVGYGITAPELNYDEYKGLDVKGKIVLMEREVPVSPSKEPEEFKKWRPYSFHQYKVKNARAHGAVGMLYNYHITNPNCLYIKDLVLTYVGETIVKDIFLGTGKTHQKMVEKIKKTRKPQSFRVKKTVSIRNVTEHHAEGTARNVIGYIEGSNPELKKEAIIIGGHLDHLGYNHKMMPGADDNASGVSVILGLAKAIKKSKVNPKRTVIFIFFAAEEQGVKGSEYYLKHPFMPNENIKGFFNIDGVGRGNRLVAAAGKNCPELWRYIEEANRKYIHRTVKATHLHNLARPRLDAARFMWASIPSISFSAKGADPLPYAHYHRTTDKPDIITPEIMEDLAQLLLIAIMQIAEY